jgi:hypothetical protein
MENGGTERQLDVARLCHAVTAVHQRISSIVDEVCLPELAKKRSELAKEQSRKKKKYVRSGMRELLLLYYVETYGVANGLGEKITRYTDTLGRIRWRFPELGKDKAKFANCVGALFDLKLLGRRYLEREDAAKLFGRENISKRGVTYVLVLTVEGAARLRAFEEALTDRFMEWVNPSPLGDEIRRTAPQVLNSFSDWLIDRWKAPRVEDRSNSNDARA